MQITRSIILFAAVVTALPVFVNEVESNLEKRAQASTLDIENMADPQVVGTLVKATSPTTTSEEKADCSISLIYDYVTC
ncbi:hypothetical protein HD806DRAFT_543285 [Xylariaceae sp. AK1471]|nr:hypothetical protein HD806DRAFT_543285 [Xylariaceae sp. AK1471]